MFQIGITIQHQTHKVCIMLIHLTSLCCDIKRLLVISREKHRLRIVNQFFFRQLAYVLFFKRCNGCIILLCSIIEITYPSINRNIRTQLLNEFQFTYSLWHIGELHEFCIFEISFRVMAIEIHGTIIIIFSRISFSFCLRNIPTKNN